MIILKNLFLSFSEQKVFEDINCNFAHNQRVGLVGRNGMGKSTLLKAIAGELTLDDGYISIEKDKKIAYMPQEVVLLSNKNVFDEAFSVFDNFISLEKEKYRLDKLFETGDSVTVETNIDLYTSIIEQLENFDKSTAIKKTEEILIGLGFFKEKFELPVSNLSVGWKMRLLLAKLLLQNADFYLFDEPTNHLDIVAKQWFFNFLKNISCGFLLVSHDRFYLENLCDNIFEVERGRGTLYYGNFSEYLRQKEEKQRVLQLTHERQQKEIAKKQALVDRFRAGTRAKMAQSVIKQLEKIEVVEPEPIIPTIKFKFPEFLQSGKTVLKFGNLKKTFDNTLIFDNVSAEIERCEKVALVAPNGTGKTTLFNLIIDKYKSEQGSIEFGHNVKYAIFEQDQLVALDPENTIFQEISSNCTDVEESVIRNFLGSFLFNGDDIKKKIKVLSGGERNRVAMIKVLLKKANFLILDEPTNHLDIYAKEVLLQALKIYKGTIFFVSHDYDFLNKLATRVLELALRGLYSYMGNFESYLAQKQHEKQKENKIAKNNLNVEILDKAKKIEKKPKTDLLESKISQAEKKIAHINKLFETCAYGTKEYDDLVNKLASTKKELDLLINQWENSYKLE